MKRLLLQLSIMQFSFMIARKYDYATNMAMSSRIGAFVTSCYLRLPVWWACLQQLYDFLLGSNCVEPIQRC